MKTTKPDWYEQAKGGLGQTNFTEPMKKEVTRKIYERQPERKKNGKWFVAAVTAIAICIAAFILIPARTIDQPPAPAGTLATPDINTPNPLPTESNPPTETQPPIAKERVELAYEDPRGSLGTLGNYPVELERIEATRIPKSSVIVKRVIEVAELGNYFVYVKDKKDTQLYAGMEIVSAGLGSSPTDDIYEIGIVGDLTYLNDVQITKSNLFGRFHLRIYGVCGANCVTNNWIHFEEDVPGVPISDIRLNAHAQEVDLDEDGTPELVSTESSTIAKVQVYKTFNDQVKFVDLNIALQAEHPNSVLYDGNSRTFTAIFADRNVSYQYKKGEDVLVRVDPIEKDQNRLIVGGTYDGNDSIQLDVEGTIIDASWVKDPLKKFGIYLPAEIRTVKFEDGYEYKSTVGDAIIQLREANEGNLPTLRKEKDLENYSDYVGTEFWGDKQDIRYDYFLYEHDSGNKTYIAVRCSTDDIGKLRPLLLAVISNIRYASE